MKTAKEMCEEIKKEKLEYILKAVQRSLGIAEFDSYYLEEHKDTLEKLGYKVEKREEEIAPRYYEERSVFVGREPSSKFLWFDIPGKPIYKTERIPVGIPIKRTYYIVRACCGECDV